MEQPSRLNLLVGIALLILGILIAVGALGIPYFQLILGIAAIVFGALMILGTVVGPRWLGIVLVVFGVLLLATGWLGTVAAYLEIAANLLIGIGLAALGVLKLFEKW